MEEITKYFSDIEIPSRLLYKLMLASSDAFIFTRLFKVIEKYGIFLLNILYAPTLLVWLAFSMAVHFYLDGLGWRYREAIDYAILYLYTSYPLTVIWSFTISLIFQVRRLEPNKPFIVSLVLPIVWGVLILIMVFLKEVIEIRIYL